MQRTDWDLERRRLRRFAHVCDLCGGTFDDSELNCEDKLVLDTAGKWIVETSYRCFACVKRAVFG